MKKTLIAAAALLAVTIAVSACKKETAQPAKLKVKSIGDIKEHTGWDRGDSTGIGEDGGSSLLRTAVPEAAAALKTKITKKPK